MTPASPSSIVWAAAAATTPGRAGEPARPARVGAKAKTSADANSRDFNTRHATPDETLAQLSSDIVHTPFKGGSRKFDDWWPTHLTPSAVLVKLNFLTVRVLRRPTRFLYNIPVFARNYAKREQRAVTLRMKAGVYGLGSRSSSEDILKLADGQGGFRLLVRALSQEGVDGVEFRERVVCARVAALLVRADGD